MYYIYEIKLNGFIYVGCTNFIRRRKDQHNENARKEKSKLGRYLKENNIVLERKDLKVIAQFINRNDALNYERQTALKYAKENKPLLNDNYSNECSRKGKYTMNYMEYYVIDIVEHTATYTNDLLRYATNTLKVSYKALVDSLNKTHICNERYKIFHKDIWLDIEDKDKWLNGDKIKEILKESKLSATKKHSKTYLVKTPNGEIIKITNADKFAREHNLTAGTFHNTLTKHNTTKGYGIIKCI